MKKVALICFTILFNLFLFAQNGTILNFKILDIAKSLSNQKSVSLSQFVNNISFVPLETNSQALLKEESADYEVIKDYIIVKQPGENRSYQIFLFDRKTGKFIRQIGKFGRGPGEFAMQSEIPFNPIKQELYALNYSRDIIAYDLSGKTVDLIKVPYIPDFNINLPGASKAINEKLGSTFLKFYNVLDSNIFVGYFQNFSGKEKRKILLYKGAVLKIFPNYLTWERGSGGGFLFPPGGFAKFYKWDNKVNFLEFLCDTLYEVTKDRLKPRYYFDTHPYKAEYSKQIEVADKWYDYLLISGINENKNYIFIHLMLKRKDYLAIVEKRNNNITVCKLEAPNISSIIDDINGLTNVVPYQFTSENEMVYIIKPSKLLSWLKENPEKAAQAKKRLPWLKNIDEFSNPIIAIGKCND